MFKPALIAILLITVIAFSCKSSKKTNALIDKGKVPAISKIYTISQGPCFGKCPVFEITLQNDSTLRLNGKNFMNYIGNYRKKLSPSEYTGLVKLRDEIKLDTFKDEYRSGIVDLAAVNYVFFDTYNAVSKKVFTHGVYPDPLQALLTNTRAYIGQLGWERDTEAESLNPDELIIQLKAGNKIEKVVEENWRYKLFIKDTLSETSLIYLMGFDKSTIEQDRLIDVLKVSDQVLYVQKNRKLELRQ